jgi:hypothetical protein
MVSSNCFNDKLTDSGGIVFGEVLLGFKRRGPFSRSVLGEGEDLVEVSIKSDQIFFDQCVSGPEILIETEAQRGTDFIIAVVGQAVTVGGQDQKQVEKELMMGEGVKEALP